MKGLIILVDDEPETVEAHREGLVGLGFSVEILSSRDDLNEFKGRKATPHCIVLDMLLPWGEESEEGVRGHTGVSIYSELRFCFPGVPLVIFT